MNVREKMGKDIVNCSISSAKNPMCKPTNEAMEEIFG